MNISICTIVTTIESIINSVDNISLTQSQYSIIIKWGSRSLQTPNSLTMKGWSSLEYISISCLNSKNRCSSFISRDLTTTKVSGSTSRISRALARNMSPNTPLPTNSSKACEENELVKSTSHICMQKLNNDLNSLYRDLDDQRKNMEGAFLFQNLKL